ncbi:hypothetical protein B0A49_08081 [Cryomyces minteri]|uniref:Cryptic loci regulator 2 N-terminal domain-containing protein n=1 Tax=Cryomyces minteri TaxID=331657 RepID=A0A4U0WZI6_9PEZI|nr:hypothetical protein B0A49_08081 [Cryomyces minteri]
MAGAYDLLANASLDIASTTNAEASDSEPPYPASEYSDSPSEDDTMPKDDNLDWFKLYPSRSDGKRETTNAKGQKEQNQPTPQQLDSSPNDKGVVDYYRPVARGDPKDLDWRRKLGGMLMRELGTEEEKKTNNILDFFPENYRLYEHVKNTPAEEEGQKVKSTKNHAGGGNDRQDAYLYGHPQGRKKRYRSPLEFLPHLLWLCLDNTGDPNDCSCKICYPEDEEKALLARQHQLKQENAVEKDGTPSTMTATAGKPDMGTPRPSSSSALQSHAGTAQAMVPPNLPLPRTVDQDVDAQWDVFLFRPGEVVWYNRGPAWGLGVVAQRYNRRGTQQQATRYYIVQPFSHPFYHPDLVTIDTEQNLRSWLAWSAPDFMNEGLKNSKVTFDTADWQGIFEKKYGMGDAQVDGSILAAKAIDDTYTCFDLLGTSAIQSGTKEFHWAGLFLGAEKIWIGEAVRLRHGSGTDIMVVNDIVENAHAGTQPTLHIVGSVYGMATIVHGTQALPDNSRLPVRVQRDMHFRNSITVPANGTSSYWKLQMPFARFSINDIKGRWYETSLISPILVQASFAESVRHGEVKEAGVFMNSRGDCNGEAHHSDVRKSNRKAALGRAVPSTLKIVDGIEPPPPSQLPPSQQHAALPLDPAFEDGRQQQVPQTEMADVAHGALDEFMNLEGMDNDMPGFGQRFY